MKKNLRIVSAAAAALLAVAPIAASTATVNADSNQLTVVGGTTQQEKDTNLTFSIAPAQPVKNNTKASDVKVNFVTNQGKGTALNPNTYIFKVSDAASLNSAASVKAAVDAHKNVETLKSGEQYVVVAEGLGITGLANSTKYTINGTSTTMTTTAWGNLDLGVVKSQAFSTTDSTNGTPYFFTKHAQNGVAANTVVNSGSVKATTLSVSGVLSAIEAQYGSAVNGTGSINSSWSTSDKDIKDQLKAANIDVKNDGTFATPANSVVINYTAVASNGNKVTMPVVVSFNQPAEQYLPVFNYNGHDYNNGQEISLTSTDAAKFGSIKLNGSVDTDAIKKAFSAHVQGDQNNKIAISVDSSRVNTKVAGKYFVTVSAKNPAGKTAKVTFQVTVGDPTAEYKTIKQDATIYNIDGNKVTASSNTTTKDSSIAVYDTTTIDGKSYTRINSKDSNEWVLTSAFDAPKEEASKSATVMFKSAIYNKDMKKTGNHIKGYNDANFVVDKDGNLKEFNLNGDKMYKIANKDEYVRVRNVTGTKNVTLKKNAYVYKSNGKKAQRKVLKKGTKVTVYGDAYKAIKKYRKTAYRIGHNKYIKYANIGKVDLY